MLFSTEVLTPANFTPEQFNIENVILKISLIGTFELYNSVELFVYIKIINRGGINKVLLDLKALNNIDSTGIGVLMQSANLLRMNNGEIAIVDIPDNILKIFKKVKLDRLVKTFTSKEDSISFLNAN